MIPPERSSVLADIRLLALRRTLWQLLAVGAGIAVLLGRYAPEQHALAWWSVLVPATALLVHFRHALQQRWACLRADPPAASRMNPGSRRTGSVPRRRRRPAMARRPARLRHALGR